MILRGYRPASYWDNPISSFLSSIKGERRRRQVQELLERGDVHEIQDWMLSAELTDEEREFFASIHPTLMGGEYLPGLEEGEVEIARSSLQSTTADVISVRARPAGSKIHYRVVDEYETVYACEPVSSDQPLTMGELIHLIEHAEDRGPDGFLEGLRVGAGAETHAERQENLDFVTVTSEFYPELEDYYEEKAGVWVEAAGDPPKATDPKEQHVIEALDVLGIGVEKGREAMHEEIRRLFGHGSRR